MILLAFAVALAKHATFAMEHSTGQAVPAFAAIQLGQSSAAFGLIIDVGQRVQRFLDPPELCQRLGQTGRTIPRLQSAHDAGRRYPAELERPR
ncbi:hypothetical protein D3C71_1624750 [compost metagenome]